MTPRPNSPINAGVSDERSFGEWFEALSLDPRDSAEPDARPTDRARWTPPPGWPGGYAGFVCGWCGAAVDADLRGNHDPDCRHATMLDGVVTEAP